MIPPHRLFRLCLCLTLACRTLSPVAASDAQRREIEQVRPGIEGWLRQNLLKLEGWQIKDLLRTEQQVDREQKRRANLSTNPMELAQLALDEDAGVRFYVAANEHTALGTRLGLARDGEATVRSGVAMSLRYDPVASRQVRGVVSRLGALLARDPNILVRMALAGEAILPPETFEILAQDPDPVIRRLVATRTQTPPRVLSQLATDSQILVRTTALRHRSADPELLARVARSGGIAERMALCDNPNTSVLILDALAADSNPLIRRRAARHPNMRLTTLRRLAGDSDLGVVQAVAEHPRSDRRLLTQLAYDDRDAQVRLTAQERLEPLLRREIRDDILERWQAN